MDCEMFFGEQRYVEPFIRDFMEFVGKIPDDEWKIGFKKQIKFNIDRYKKELNRGDDEGSSGEIPKGDEEEEDAVSEEDKYSDQYVDYDEKQERENPFVGLPTDFRPNQENRQKILEELGNLS